MSFNKRFRKCEARQLYYRLFWLYLFWRKYDGLGK